MVVRRQRGIRQPGNDGHCQRTVYFASKIRVNVYSCILLLNGVERPTEMWAAGHPIVHALSRCSSPKPRALADPPARLISDPSLSAQPAVGRDRARTAAANATDSGRSRTLDEAGAKQTVLLPKKQILATNVRNFQAPPATYRLANWPLPARCYIPATVNRLAVERYMERQDCRPGKQLSAIGVKSHVCSVMLLISGPPND
jgi:hypothetical protein